MFVFGVLELLLLVRFLLLLVGANTQTVFVQWIHDVSGIFMSPFNAILGVQTINGQVFEWSALVAILVYAVLAWLIVALIRALTPRRGPDTVETVEPAPAPVVARKRSNWWRRA